MKGIPVSHGISIGKARLLDDEIYDVSRVPIRKASVNQELARFNKALADTRTELTELQKHVLENSGQGGAEFFNVHLLIIEDRLLIDSIEFQIRDKLANAEYAVYQVMEKEVKKLLAVDDEYIRERVVDLYDIGKRILRHLMQKEKTSLGDLPPETILVANDLSPADTASLDLTRVKGFVTNKGGKTSHTAILARSLDLPAVVGTRRITSVIKNNDTIIVDSNTGKVVIQPDEKTLKLYQTAMHVYEKFKHSLVKLAHLDATTLDGHKIHLAGNIEMPEEADMIVRNGGYGIGLYRTEFLYLNRTDLPAEEELFRVFKDIVVRMNPAPVVFRTIDLGGDKFNRNLLDTEADSNPFLGWRAIRYCLENPEVFSVQLRALLRASAFGNARIMFPMICDVNEILKTLKLIEKIKKDLRSKNIRFDKDLEFGSMIEIPSAALTADVIGKHVSFFSVGTNDLIQYTLAVDRNNPKIANLFDPFHPSVIKLLKIVTDSAKYNGIKAQICGELGSDPMAVPLLVGLGFDELSVPPSSIPEVKRIVRSITYSQACEIAGRVLEMKYSTDIYKYLRKSIKEIAPDVFHQMY